MKILHFLNDYETSGGEAVFVNWMVSAIKDMEQSVLSYKSFRFNPISSFVKMCKNINHCDIVHFHNVTNLISWIIIFCSIKKKKIVTMHCPEMKKKFPKHELNELRRIIQANLISLLCDRIIFLNNWSKERYLKRTLFKKLFLKKSMIIYNSINAGFFEKPIHKIRKNKKNKKFEILFVGDLSIRKGIPNLVEVIERLNKKPDVAFTIVGGGKLVDEVKKASKKYKNLQYLGVLRGQKLMIEYDSADALILPSFGEQCPLVILEAMARRCIILASDIAVMKEIITDGKNGFLFSPYDNMDMMRKIMDAKLVTEQKSSAITNYNLNLLKMRFNPTVQIQKYINEYKSLL